MADDLEKQAEDGEEFDTTNWPKIRGPIRIDIPAGYIWGEEGAPTQEQYDAFLKESLYPFITSETQIVYVPSPKR
jgi:hypothetical protein